MVARGLKRGLAALVGLLALGLAPTNASAEADLCDADSLHRLEIVVDAVRSSEGLMTVELYDDNPEGFIKKLGRIKRARVNASQGETALCLKLPGPGRYAVVVYHDENANRKFDKTLIGLPAEGFGISRNPKIDFGLPDHADAAFDVADEAPNLRIHMTYW